MSGTANATWLIPTTPWLGAWLSAIDVAATPTSVPARNRARPRMSSSCCSDRVESASAHCALRPVRAGAADDDHDQPERQIDHDDLTDAVETGGGGRPLPRIDRALERKPRPVKQPDEQR